MSRLSELLVLHREEILGCFEKRVVRSGLMPGQADEEEILDSVPRIFDAIVRSLDAPREGGPDDQDELRAARSHGQNRRAIAMDLQGVVREYAYLRDCILDLASTHAVTPTVEEIACLNRCLDVAIQIAIEEYAAHRDSEVVRERAVIEAERRRLRTTIGLLPVAVLLTDASGRGIEANHAMRALWPSRGEPFLAGPSDRFEIKTADGQLIAHSDLPLTRALQRGEPTHDAPLEVKGDDGSRKTILVSAAPTRDGNGAIDGAVVVHVDISSHAEALRETRLAVKTREDILAIVAHDLKNPLNSIHIAASRLERGVDEKSAASLGATVNRAVRRMDRLVTDLLVLAKLEAGHLVLNREPVDLRLLVREAIEHVRPLAQAKSVWLEKERLEATPIVECDRARIDQVLANLLGNAVKFTPEGGSVTVRLTIAGERVVIEVADTGPGIASDAVPRVFDRFWQSRESASIGHGLGLAIARGIVDAHGGEIWVESTLGVGSKFFFALPLTEVSSSSRWKVSRE